MEGGRVQYWLSLDGSVSLQTELYKGRPGYSKRGSIYRPYDSPPHYTPP